MDFSYNYYGQMPFEDDGLLAFIGVIYGIVILVGLAVSIACYVMRSLGVYTIAKRRGLNNPWLAWLPVGDAWILGMISDQFQYIVKGQNKSRRKVLLGLNIGCMASGVIVVIAVIAMFVQLIAAEIGGALSDSRMASIIMGPLLVVLAIAFALMAVSIVSTVFRYMCMYDLFRSCDPGNAVAYLVLSIVGTVVSGLIPFGVLLEPIFLLVVRKKDLGMPPRKQPETPNAVPTAVQPEPAVKQLLEEE